MSEVRPIRLRDSENIGVMDFDGKNEWGQRVLTIVFGSDEAWWPAVALPKAIFDELFEYADEEEGDE